MNEKEQKIPKDATDPGTARADPDGVLYAVGWKTHRPADERRETIQELSY